MTGDLIDVEFRYVEKKCIGNDTVYLKTFLQVRKKRICLQSCAPVWSEWEDVKTEKEE